MKRRLALACARGWRQESFLNEALAGPVQLRHDSFGYVRIGDTGLQWASFRNLRKRLTGVGFVVIVSSTEVRLQFPEEEQA